LKTFAYWGIVILIVKSHWRNICKGGLALKILLVSDVESKSLWDHYNPEKLKDVELIISCGDLKAEYLSFLVTMTKARLFYVHGNHDDDYIHNPPGGCECIDGKLVNYNGIRILGLGGSIKYKDGPFKYTKREMEKRILKLRPRIFLNKGFDILVTHAAAYKLGDGDDFCHTGFESFNALIDKYSPKYYIHGHQHLNYGRNERTIQYKNTTVINAYDHHYLDYE
jgi:Icc-related predicted phosphoesterase